MTFLIHPDHSLLPNLMSSLTLNCVAQEQSQNKRFIMKKFQNVEGIALKVLKKGVEESKGDTNHVERSSDVDEN